MNISSPQHVAIVMDGNGRWAKQRFLPRFMGHHKGVDAVKAAIRSAIRHQVKVLTLFAFSTENWHRPPDEVSELMALFLRALNKELPVLQKEGIRFLLIGDRTRFSEDLQKAIAEAERLTEQNATLTLVIAANYGGQWDIVQAANRAMQKAHDEGRAIEHEDVQAFIALGDLPPVDLFIRTGGEKRLSNFLLWQMAYAELFFTDQLWPDMNEQAFTGAFEAFSARERRFGKTSEQITQQ